jgi:hypothetical protein
MNDTIPVAPQDPSVRKEHLLKQDSIANNTAADTLSLIFRRIGTGDVLELSVSPLESVAAVRSRLATAAATTRSHPSPLHGGTSPCAEQEAIQMVYGGRCLRDSDRMLDIIGHRGSSAPFPVYFSISKRSNSVEKQIAPGMSMLVDLAPSKCTSSVCAHMTPSSASAAATTAAAPLPISPSSLSAALRWLEVCDPRVHAQQAKRVRDVLAVYGVETPSEWVPCIETSGAHFNVHEDMDRWHDVTSPPVAAPEPQTTAGDAAAGGEVAAAAAEEEPEAPIPAPNWLDLYIIPNIVFGLYLFGEKLSLPMQVGGEFGLLTRL